MRPAGRPPVSVGLPETDVFGHACGPGFVVTIAGLV